MSESVARKAPPAGAAEGVRPKLARRKRVISLPTQPPKQATFSLTDCHRMLVRDLGEDQAPVLRTLKRHAAAGTLKRFEDPRKTSGRPMYQYSKLREHYQPVKRSAAAVLASPGTAPSVDPQVLAAAVDAAVARGLEPLVQQLQSIGREVGGLAGVRQALMLKYDAAAAGTLARLEQTQQHLQDTKRLLDLDNQVRMLRADVARLAESLERRAA